MTAQVWKRSLLQSRCPAGLGSLPLSCACKCISQRLMKPISSCNARQRCVLAGRSIAPPWDASAAKKESDDRPSSDGQARPIRSGCRSATSASVSRHTTKLFTSRSVYLNTISSTRWRSPRASAARSTSALRTSWVRRCSFRARHTSGAVRHRLSKCDTRWYAFSRGPARSGPAPSPLVAASGACGGARASCGSSSSSMTAASTSRLRSAASAAKAASGGGADGSAPASARGGTR